MERCRCGSMNPHPFCINRPEIGADGAGEICEMPSNGVVRTFPVTLRRMQIEPDTYKTCMDVLAISHRTRVIPTLTSFKLQWFSLISPRGCSLLSWKDRWKGRGVATYLLTTAFTLYIHNRRGDTYRLWWCLVMACDRFWEQPPWGSMHATRVRISNSSKWGHFYGWSLSPWRASPPCPTPILDICLTPGLWLKTAGLKINYN